MLTWMHAQHLSLTAVEPQVTADTLPPLSSDFELQSKGALSIDWSWVSARLRFKASSWTWGDSKNVKCSQTTLGMTAPPYDERPVEASQPSVCAAVWGGFCFQLFFKKSHSLHLPPLLLQKSADHFLWLLAASSPAFLGLVFLYHFFILITAPSSTEVMTLPQLVFLSFPIRLTRLPPAYCLAPPGPFNEVLKRFPWADLTSWPSLSVAGHRCWSDWNRELLADIWLWTICL